MDIQTTGDSWDTPYNPPNAPTGIPDPNNPGYDTAGYPLPGRTAPPAASGTGPGSTPGPAATPAPAPTDNPAPPDPSPSPSPAPNPSSGALANYSVPAPAFPNEPAYTPTTFQAPSIADALQDPYYQAEQKAGTDALQRWAAYRGTVNDTGTANALEDYGLNSATQRLNDVWGRDFTAWQANENANRAAYGLNRQTQYVDPWTAAYNAWVQQGNWYLQNQGTVAGTALGFAQL